MARLSLIERTIRGVGAGVAGTAVMTAWQEIAAKLQGPSGSDGRADLKSGDPWEQASAPAKVGRMVLGGLGYDVPASQIGRLTSVMHWGYGTAWGGIYGAVMGASARDRPLARGLAFGTCVWVMSYMQLVPLGIYELPWKYPPKTLALDLSYHLAYGAGLGAAGALVEG